MNTLQVGFARLDITPMLGIPITGYYIPRFAEGVLDPIEVNALAITAGDNTVVLMAVDSVHVPTKEVELYCRRVEETLGLPAASVLIHSTHTHTSPAIGLEDENVLVREYSKMLFYKLTDAARLALADRKPAKMGWSVGHAPDVAFMRRFRMKDGSIRTNPGVGNPDILCPLGEVDTRVGVVRFDRVGGDTLVMVNFGNHPDTIGGSRLSADWPGFLRRRVEKALDNVRCVFFNGAQGDVNHVNVYAAHGDFNDLVMDFDDVARGYGHARHMGNVMAGAVLQVYDKVNYVDVDRVCAMQKMIEVPSNMPAPEEMARAHEIHALHTGGQDDRIPFRGMELTTVVAEAQRMVELEHGPASFPLRLSGAAIGSVAILGIPGEPFTGIGCGLKEADGWDLVLPMCLTNGAQGYFPMQEAYEEGGYEARSSLYKAGVAEIIIAEGKKLLSRLQSGEKTTEGGTASPEKEE